MTYSKVHKKFLATVEARVGSCADFAETHLLFKTSEDGINWTPSKVLVKKEGETIGQSSPFELTDGTIILAFNANNFDSYMMQSRDGGVTWSVPLQIEGIRKDNWTWVAFGPPAGLQLKSGRLVIPCYHSDVTYDRTHDDWIDRTWANLANLRSRGHVVISDDNGKTWRLNQDSEKGDAFMHAVNESSVAQLDNGDVILIARNGWLFPHSKIALWSTDECETFSDPSTTIEISEPLTGVSHSLVSKNNVLYLTTPTGSSFYRRDLKLYSSTDSGHKWSEVTMVKEGQAGYSAMAVSNDSLYVLYETNGNSG